MDLGKTMFLMFSSTTPVVFRFHSSCSWVETMFTHHQENGRVAEVAARKQTEVEFQNFQTRKYESSLATEPRPPGPSSTTQTHTSTGFIREIIQGEYLELDPLAQGGGTHTHTHRKAPRRHPFLARPWGLPRL